MFERIRLILAVVLLTHLPASTQVRYEEIYPEPDTRFKTDILLIVAHPDDETAIGSFLAKMIFDENKTVAAIYSTRGQGGGNSIGNEQSEALGDIREIEVRKALAKFGVQNVWFLDGYDTPGQDVFHSLHNVNHGSALEKTVRLMRLTRPEIVITWLPQYVSGENHGDHQASGVLAVEAFDQAGDPTVFPTQTAVARDRADILNFNHGLRPWQPKKLYFFSDREKGIDAPGPAFDLTASSTTQSVPYYELAAQLHIEHRVQGDVADVGREAMDTEEYAAFIEWLSRYNLIFGKSLVSAKAKDPLFEGIQAGAIAYEKVTGYKPLKKRGISLQAGGAFQYYRQFLRAHDLPHLVELVKSEVTVSMGSYVHFPLLLSNHTRTEVKLELSANTPEDWSVYTGPAEYLIPAGATLPVQTLIQAPWEERKSELISWQISRDGRTVQSIDLDVKLVEWNLPQ